MTTDIPAAAVPTVHPAGALTLEPPILRTPPAIRAWPALAATASVAGIALVVTAAHEAALPASSPIDAPGRWGAALAGGVALAFAGYVCGIVALRRRAVPVAAVIAVAAAVQLMPLAGPTLVLLWSIEKPGWMVILGLVPIVNIAFGLWLLFTVPVTHGRTAWWGLACMVPLVGYYAYAFTLADSTSQGSGLVPA